MYDEKTKTQYEIMTVENTNQDGKYVPNLEALIQEAPCEEMAKAWESVADLIERCKNTEHPFAFTFRTVYTHKKTDGTYTIYQHPMPDDWDMEKCEAELERWVTEVEN